MIDTLGQIHLMAKSKEHYVNNKEYIAAIIDYKDKVEIAKLKGLKKPAVGEYIGSCFLKIAQHLSYKPNFVNYMFKDDMIGDGIENCITYIDNFDPNKSRNPFAYFTQIIYYAFLRRIQKEKKQVDIKTKIIEKSGHNELFSADAYGNKAEYEGIKTSLEQRYRQ